MWLLQLDLANHSQWTRELESFPDAFQHRRQFAIGIEQSVGPHGFSRLAWAGDGGVFAADARLPVTVALECARLIHTSFEGWQAKTRLANRLGLSVSLHRALVTTADDPAYCFGTHLNEFMKRERDLRDPSAACCTTITGATYRLLTYEQQTGWELLHESIGSLGRVYRLASNDSPFDWLVGAWIAKPLDDDEDGVITAAYADIDDLGNPFVVYSYAGDDEHTGSYENIRWQNDDMVGTFGWIHSPINGHFRLTPSADRLTMSAGWWYAEDVTGDVAPPYSDWGGVHNMWIKVPDKPLPRWAEEAIHNRKTSPHLGP